MWSEIRPEQRKKGMKQKSSHSKMLLCSNYPDIGQVQNLKKKKFNPKFRKNTFLSKITLL